MSIHTYVASRYDVEYHNVNITFQDFQDMFYDLLDLSQNNEDLPEITYSTNDYNDWYEIDKEPLEGMLNYLKSLERVNDVLLDEKHEKVCSAKYIDTLEQALAPVGKDMTFLRIEFE